MQTKIIERYFFFALLLLTTVFTVLVFRPFWAILLLSICFSVLLYPIYKWFNKLKFPNWLSSLLTLLIFMIILGVLFFGAGAIILNQTINVYNFVANNSNTIPYINSLNNSINKILPAGTSFDLHEKISNLISLFVDNLTGIFSYTLSTLFYFFLFFLSIFYFLKDGEKFEKGLIAASPLSDSDNEKIVNKLALSINSILKGNFFVVILQGAVVTVGFFLFKVPNPALWGLVAVITSFVPTIGSGLITIPIIIFLFLTGNTLNAIGLLVWAVIVVGVLGTLLNPIIVGKKINLHPMVILFSVLGGISLFGPIGILVGPLSVSLLYALVSIYKDEFKQSAVL